MTLARLTLWTLSLCAAPAACAVAQEPANPPATQTTAPAATPAPIVRKPKPQPPATDAAAPSQSPAASTPAPAPHLTVAKPVVRTPSPAATSSSTSPAPKPVTPKPPAAKLADIPTTQLVTMNRTLIVLDPAHGAGDTGSRMSDQLAEKDITLAIAFRLRSLLSARGFTVIMTRDNDEAASAPGTPLTLDDRAGIANHARPVACLLLHATASGSGVHLYTSELAPTPGEPPLAPWLTAQAAWVTQSQRLAAQIATAMGRAHIALVQSRASIRPVDSLTCPALVLELAPNGSDASTLADAGYQQRVAEAVVGAMVFWQNQAQPPVRLAPPPTPVTAPTPTEAQP